eukprot:Clim_evm2s73 gene=Clim_evmTU2s73
MVDGTCSCSCCPASEPSCPEGSDDIVEQRFDTTSDQCNPSGCASEFPSDCSESQNIFTDYDDNVGGLTFSHFWEIIPIIFVVILVLMCICRRRRMVIRRRARRCRQQRTGDMQQAEAGIASPDMAPASAPPMQPSPVAGSYPPTDVPPAMYPPPGYNAGGPSTGPSFDEPPPYYPPPDLPEPPPSKHSPY